MRRTFATTSFLVLATALATIALHVGSVGVALAQCCDATCCGDSCCGDCDAYCSDMECCGCDGCCESGKGCCCGRCCRQAGYYMKDKVGGGCCCCQKHGWDGKRRISYQQQKDLFYNYYAQPGPFYNTPSKLYVSPQPVPTNVGHMYTTYQPFMPHEYTYRHQRAYYTYNPGAGWTRTNVRYGTCCNSLRGFCSDWHYPMTSNLWPLNQDFYHPGLRF